jgi:membrane protein YqaA with SNARE-associated domain
MEQILHFFEAFGIWGLFLLSFIESFLSPILPDVMLIPMILAVPQKAIYYSGIATIASVSGGLIGYGIGHRFGQLALNKYVPACHIVKIEHLVNTYGGWAIFLAALAPIPYKFVCITAGTFRTNFFVFLIASMLGRGKRFLLLGVLVFYYGPEALDMLDRIPNQWIWLGLGTLVIGIVTLWYVKYRHQPQSN